ncbi:MAG: DUF3226 domain-containing protein [Cyanobacteria bacterium P01_G01_bin.54]
MQRGNASKILLVEGKSEQFLIPELMEANGIDWPARNPPIYIEDCGGYEKIADQDAIAAELQNSNLTALGIVVDADEYPDRRWQSLRNACLPSIPDLPETLPDTGLIHSHFLIPERQIQFGIWIMPDNLQRGMLETFLAYLLPEQTTPLWQYAQEVVQVAKNELKAKIKAVQVDKANIHTWLAWQDEPGLQLHTAVQKKVFDPNHPRAQEFVTWFNTLYDFEDLQ